MNDYRYDYHKLKNQLIFFQMAGMATALAGLCVLIAVVAFSSYCKDGRRTIDRLARAHAHLVKQVVLSEVRSIEGDLTPREYIKYGLAFNGLSIDDSVMARWLKELGGYSWYMIDAHQGEVIYPPQKASEPLEDLTARYRSAAIYQIKNQKQGWFEYPQKRFVDFTKGRHIIRFLYDAELDWIIAFEAYQESGLEFLTRHLNGGVGSGLVLWGVMGVLVAAIVLANVLTQIIYVVVRHREWRYKRLSLGRKGKRGPQASGAGLRNRSQRLERRRQIQPKLEKGKPVTSDVFPQESDDIRGIRGVVRAMIDEWVKDNRDVITGNLPESAAIKVHSDYVTEGFSTSKPSAWGSKDDEVLSRQESSELLCDLLKN